MWIWLVCVAAFALSNVSAAGAGAARLICYVRNGGTAFPECTHLVYIGNARGYHLEAQLKEYKMHNPQAKIMLRVTFADQDLPSLLASSNADGLEIFEAHRSLNRTKILKIVHKARTALRAAGGGSLFLALPAHPELLAKYYDLRELVRKVDLMTVQTHALGVVRGMTYHPSRLSGLWDMMNTDSVVDLVIGLGVPVSKIVISLPTTVGKFTLVNETLSTPGSPTVEEYPKEIDHVELCRLLQAGGWTLERDQDLSAPYAFRDKTWLSFEDSVSVDVKGKYARVRALAGLALYKAERDVETPCGPALRTILQKVLNQQSRAPRSAVLRSLEHDILSEPGYASALGPLQVSPYRINQVVDSDGVIHSVREDTRTEFTCSRQGYFRHPRSCGRFYRCVKFDQNSPDYTVFEFDCPPGLAFDSRYEVCGWPGSIPDSKACPGSSEIAPVPKKRFVCPSKEGYYADPENCRWFFACLNHGKKPLTAYEFRCPFGLGFDEKRLKCDWPWRVPTCGNIGKYEAQAFGFSGGSLGEKNRYRGRTSNSANIVAHHSHNPLSGAALDNLGGIHSGFQKNNYAYSPNYNTPYNPKKFKYNSQVVPLGYSNQGHFWNEQEARSYYNNENLGFAQKLKENLVYSHRLNENSGFTHKFQQPNNENYYSGSSILANYRIPGKDIFNSFPGFGGGLKTYGFGSNSGAYVHDPSGDYAEPYKHLDVPAIPYSHEYTEYKHKNNYNSYGEDSSSQSNEGVVEVVQESSSSESESIDYADLFKKNARKHQDPASSSYISKDDESKRDDSKNSVQLETQNINTFYNDYVNHEKPYPEDDSPVGIRTLPNGAIAIGLVGKTSLVDAGYTDQSNYDRFRNGAGKFLGNDFDHHNLQYGQYGHGPVLILPANRNNKQNIKTGQQTLHSINHPVVVSSFKPKSSSHSQETIHSVEAYSTPRTDSEEPLKKVVAYVFKLPVTKKPSSQHNYSGEFYGHTNDFASTVKPENLFEDQVSLQSDDEEDLFKSLLKKFKTPNYIYKYTTEKPADDDNGFGVTHRYKLKTNAYKSTTTEPTVAYTQSKQDNFHMGNIKLTENTGETFSTGYDYPKPTIQFEEIPKTLIYSTSPPIQFNYHTYNENDQIISNVYHSKQMPFSASNRKVAYERPVTIYENSALKANNAADQIHEVKTSSVYGASNINAEQNAQDKTHELHTSSVYMSFDKNKENNAQEKTHEVQSSSVYGSLGLSGAERNDQNKIHEVQSSSIYGSVGINAEKNAQNKINHVQSSRAYSSVGIDSAKNAQNKINHVQSSHAYSSVGINSAKNAQNKISHVQSNSVYGTSLIGNRKNSKTIISLPHGYHLVNASNISTYPQQPAVQIAEFPKVVYSASNPVNPVQLESKVYSTSLIGNRNNAKTIISLPHTYHQVDGSKGTYPQQSAEFPKIVEYSASNPVNPVQLESQVYDTSLIGNRNNAKTIISVPHTYHQVDGSKISTYPQQSAEFPKVVEYSAGNPVNPVQLESQVYGTSLIGNRNKAKTIISVPQTYHQVDGSKISTYPQQSAEFPKVIEYSASNPVNPVRLQSQGNKLKQKYKTPSTTPKTVVRYQQPTVTVYRNPVSHFSQKTSSPSSIYRHSKIQSKQESNRVVKQCPPDQICQQNSDVSQSFQSQPEIQRDFDYQGVQAFSDASRVSHQSDVQQNSEVVFVSSTPATLVYEDHYLENNTPKVKQSAEYVSSNIRLSTSSPIVDEKYNSQNPLQQYNSQYHNQERLGAINFFSGPEIQGRNAQEYGQSPLTTVAPTLSSTLIPQIYSTPANIHYIPPVAKDYLPPNLPEESTAFPQDYLPPPTQPSDYSLLQAYDAGSKSNSYTKSAPVTSTKQYLPPKVETTTYTPIEEKLIEVKEVPYTENKNKVAVVTKINDFNPLLVKKLGAVCSCQSQYLKLKGRRPGARILIPDYDDSYDSNDFERGEVLESKEELGPRKNPKLKSPFRTITTTTISPIIVSNDPDLYDEDVINVNTRYESSNIDNDEFVSITPKVPSTTKKVKTKSRHRITTVTPALEADEAHESSTPEVPSKNSPITLKSFNRYGPGGWRKRTETLQGSVDCKRAGLFRHPRECNKFYACNWDESKNKYSLHVFDCPVHLSFDSSIGACNWPSQGPACQGDTLLTNNV